MHHLAATFHEDHPLLRADARVKILTALALLVMVLSCQGVLFPLLVALLSLLLCRSLRVPLKTLALRFAEPGLIALAVLLLKLFFAGEVPLFTVGFWGFELTGHEDGLLEGLLAASRIFGGVTLLAVVGFSTGFTELMGALAWFRVPQVFVDVALFAFRYLFLLLDDALVVYHAQKNRLGYAGYLRGVRSFGTLAGVLVLKAFDSSQTMTTAMAQRGYTGQLPLLSQRPFAALEVLASLLVVGVFSLVRWW